MKTLALILFCGLSGIHGLKYQDLELEAIIIDDGIEFDPENFIPIEPEAITESPVAGCTTLSGITGKCIPYNTCFPYAQYLINEYKDSEVDSELLDIFNSTESCIPSEDLKRETQGDRFVCCLDYSYGLPSKKPTAPSKETTTGTSVPSEPAVPEIKAGCGATFLKDGQVINGSRVVGGRLAQKGEFPWAIALLMNGNQFCGGSLISESYVLTAAHCVQGLRDVSRVRISIGDHDVASSTDGRHESRTASKVLYHKGFSMSNLRDDIALIKLSTPVAYTNNIQPICLNTGDVPYGMKADLAGWGKISNSGPPSRTLRTVNMRIIPQTECQAEYKGTQAPPLTVEMICAGEKRALKDACNGDSGGPLSYAENGKSKQIGIVSWGIGCGEKPGVYTNVAKYLDWIKKNSQR